MAPTLKSLLTKEAENPVVRFGLTATTPAQRDAEDIKAELYAVVSTRQNLLGIEHLEAAKLDERAHQLRAEMKFAGTSYKRLSLEPLHWRKKHSSWPMFAVYPLHSPYMVIRSERAVKDNGGPWLADRDPSQIGRGESPTSLPPPITDIYRNHQRSLNDGRITSTFQGVIPKSVREDIKNAKDLFTSEASSSVKTRPDIFIIGEAKWVEGPEPRPPLRWNLEPLVVGWDGAADYVWLISQFDLTSIERYMMEEFPALPSHTNLMVLPEKK